MARSFGKDKEEKDEDGAKKTLPTDLDPCQQGASCSEQSSLDEGDSDSSSIVPGSESTSVQDIARESRHLYLDFVRTEIRRSGMDLEIPCFDRSTEETSVRDEVDAQRLMDWTRAGQELRQLADAFSRSKERQSVKKRAQNVTLDTLDVDNFFQLLQELFQVRVCFLVALFLSVGGGITRERILVLFFFCADIAIEALRRGFHQTFHQLLSWSVSYIGTRVAQYVHSVGGWGVVLRQSLDIVYHVTACAAFVAVVAACVVYIRRNLS